MMKKPLLERLQLGFFSAIRPKDDGDHPLLFWTFAMATLGIIVVLIVGITVYFSGGSEKGGQFGDLVGGIANPILTFMTIIGLLLTITLQQVELRDTRKELENSALALESQVRAINFQNFESTFFRMLDTMRALTNEVWLPGDVTQLKGRDAFQQFTFEFTNIYRNAQGNDQKKFLDTHDQFMRNYEGMLSSYFRFLAKIVQFVESSEIDKKKYISILSSTMSVGELAILAYRASTAAGIDFLIPIQKYGMLKGLEPRLHVQPEFLVFWPPMAFDENAYDEETLVREPLHFQN